MLNRLKTQHHAQQQRKTNFLLTTPVEQNQTMTRVAVRLAGLFHIERVKSSLQIHDLVVHTEAYGVRGIGILGLLHAFQIAKHLQFGTEVNTTQEINQQIVFYKKKGEKAHIVYTRY